MTVTDFLLARIAEDETVAREAMIVVGDDLTTFQIAEWWDKPEHGRVYAGHWHKVAQSGVTLGEPEVHNAAALPHIARHDPARVLAECEAKRRIVVRCSKDQVSGIAPLVHHARQTLRDLALPYADHRDYREEW